MQTQDCSDGRKHRPGISVVMSAYNEEEFIRDCLESVKEWATEIVVVDGSSQDRTQAIAREYTDHVLTTTNKLMLNVNKNIAIDAATCEWVLLLDPDERVSPELAAEVQIIAAGHGPRNAGYWMPRRNYELGRWIRAMGFYPGHQLRFFRNGKARFPCEHIHETVTVAGQVGYLRGDIIHMPRQGLADYLHKRNLYSEHRAAFLYEHGVPFKVRNLLVHPIWSFVKPYILRGGWREGMPGLIIAVTGAYGGFLQEAKLWQRWQEGRSIAHADALPSFMTASKQSTGVKQGTYAEGRDRLGVQQDWAGETTWSDGVKLDREQNNKNALPAKRHGWAP